MASWKKVLTSNAGNTHIGSTELHTWSANMSQGESINSIDSSATGNFNPTTGLTAQDITNFIIPAATVTNGQLSGNAYALGTVSGTFDSALSGNSVMSGYPILSFAHDGVPVWLDSADIAGGGGVGTLVGTASSTIVTNTGGTIPISTTTANELGDSYLSFIPEVTGGLGRETALWSFQQGGNEETLLAVGSSTSGVGHGSLLIAGNINDTQDTVVTGRFEVGTLDIVDGHVYAKNNRLYNSGNLKNVQKTLAGVATTIATGIDLDEGGIVQSATSGGAVSNYFDSGTYFNNAVELQGTKGLRVNNTGGSHLSLEVGNNESDTKCESKFWGPMTLDWASAGSNTNIQARPSIHLKGSTGTYFAIGGAATTTLQESNPNLGTMNGLVGGQNQSAASSESLRTTSNNFIWNLGQGNRYVSYSGNSATQGLNNTQVAGLAVGNGNNPLWTLVEYQNDDGQANTFMTIGDFVGTSSAITPGSNTSASYSRAQGGLMSKWRTGANGEGFILDTTGLVQSETTEAVMPNLLIQDGMQVDGVVFARELSIDSSGPTGEESTFFSPLVVGDKNSSDSGYSGPLLEVVGPFQQGNSKSKDTSFSMGDNMFVGSQATTEKLAGLDKQYSDASGVLKSDTITSSTSTIYLKVTNNSGASYTFTDGDDYYLATDQGNWAMYDVDGSVTIADGANDVVTLDLVSWPTDALGNAITTDNITKGAVSNGFAKKPASGDSRGAGYEFQFNAPVHFANGLTVTNTSNFSAIDDYISLNAADGTDWATGTNSGIVFGTADQDANNGTDGSKILSSTNYISFTGLSEQSGTTITVNDNGNFTHYKPIKARGYHFAHSTATGLQTAATLKASTPASGNGEYVMEMASDGNLYLYS